MRSVENQMDVKSGIKTAPILTTYPTLHALAELGDRLGKYHRLAICWEETDPDDGALTKKRRELTSANLDSYRDQPTARIAITAINGTPARLLKTAQAEGRGASIGFVYDGNVIEARNDQKESDAPADYFSELYVLKQLLFTLSVLPRARQ